MDATKDTGGIELRVSFISPFTFSSFFLSPLILLFPLSSTLLRFLLIRGGICLLFFFPIIFADGRESGCETREEKEGETGDMICASVLWHNDYYWSVLQPFPPTLCPLTRHDPTLIERCGAHQNDLGDWAYWNENGGQ